ncbi:MAG: trypsin-like peptidase domain-containing protein [Candidatus Berkelbacteria bacterium]|nr:MAG: trypsin-like peptidase domain-containing protein [Candidatus Berkelbacteria bacterium]QQG51551.1 MAG: trypsin-like peptidase domain-containing protein [Candidatus Berkelbacteria bacterium]
MIKIDPKQKPFFGLVVATTVIVTFLVVIGTLYFLSVTPTGERWRTALGLNDLKVFDINTTRSEKIIVEESSAIIDASKKVDPAVVSVTSIGSAMRDVFGLGTIEAPQTSGTGFVITSDGLIATNKHVVSSGEKFTVTTSNNKTYDGKVVAKDPSNDIAFLKIEETGLPVADLGDSDKVQVGQWVIAIGNALGELQNSVTVGVVSAKERSANASGSSDAFYGLLQTDAAINPGNSGGPLLTLGGQVVGINSLIAGDAEGIGFAIPVNELKKDLESYKKNSKIIQPYIGVRFQTITKAVAKSLGLAVEKGALISGSQGAAAVASGGPAEKAGIKSGDIITKVGNDEITESNPLTRLIRKYNPGDKVTLTILRDGKTQALEVTLGQLD